MTTEMKRIYLETIRARYRKSTKKEKSKILDEFCIVCSYERKYAIRILWGHVEPRSRRPGPKRTYSHKVIPHLIYFWVAMNKVHHRTEPSGFWKSLELSWGVGGFFI